MNKIASIGVPCVLGKDGMEQVLQQDLDDEEQDYFYHSVASIRDEFNSRDEIIRS